MANKACNEVVTVANMPMTVFDMISAMQNKYADRVAFRYVEGKDTVVEKTYAQYVQDIRKATGYLQQELGEPKGKKIVILSRTNYEYGAVVFGTMMAGAVIVTLNQGKTWAELEYELGMVERISSSMMASITATAPSWKHSTALGSAPWMPGSLPLRLRWSTASTTRVC